MNMAALKVEIEGPVARITLNRPDRMNAFDAALILGAERARALGLVSAVAPLPELQTQADARVADMLRTSALGLRLTKEALGLALDANSLESVMAHEDHKILCARTDAFLAKRAPQYTGR